VRRTVVYLGVVHESWLVFSVISIVIVGAAGVLSFSGARAEQKDVLFVVLEDDNGQKSAHYQQSPHESCSKFLAEFRKATRNHSRITLTFEAPPKVSAPRRCPLPPRALASLDSPIHLREIPTFTTDSSKSSPSLHR
jgi:hypothetical protein